MCFQSHSFLGNTIDIKEISFVPVLSLWLLTNSSYHIHPSIHPSTLLRRPPPLIPISLSLPVDTDVPELVSCKPGALAQSESYKERLIGSSG